MVNKKQQGTGKAIGGDIDFDIGLDDDLDLSQFDVLDDDGGEEEQTRYIRPKVRPMRPERVKYDNAVKLARELRLDFGARYDVIVSGDFIFGDFIEAFLTANNAKCRKMTITTLSLSQNNVDSLANLMAAGYIDELNLIVSVYFWGNERGSLIPYIRRRLDHGGKFQLAVAAVHTKTAQFETLGGRKVVIHGSANLRSSGNIEQFTIEEAPELYDFYDELFSCITERYATIRKPIRGDGLWAEIVKKKFND